MILKKISDMYDRFFRFDVTNSESIRHKKSLNIAILLLQTIILIEFIGTAVILLIAWMEPDVFKYILLITKLELYDIERIAFLCTIVIGIDFVIFFLNNYHSNTVAVMAFLVLLVVIDLFADSVENLTLGRSLILWIVPVVVASIISSPRSSLFVAILISSILTIFPILSGEIPDIYAIGVIILVGFLLWSLTNSFLKVLNHSRTNEQALQKTKEDQADYIDQILSLNSELEERTKGLKNAHEKLIKQEKLAAAGKISNTISHELRNPLAVISNSIYYLNMKLGDADDKTRKHIALIQAEVERSRQIITNLLDFTRVKQPEFTKVNIMVVIKNALSHVPVPDGITIQTIDNAGDPQMDIDSDLIQQAFINIITNAIQAMPQGGNLYITIGSDNKQVTVAFKDSGVGISPENIQKLFEPLFTTKKSGIGLGLALVKDIIDKHGGEIKVESEERSGTTFTIILPSTHCLV